jgi:Glyoxalase-like domain
MWRCVSTARLSWHEAALNTATSGPQALAVDHLVVAAAALAQGVQWCEKTLGVTPGPGGEHTLMGTHNRLLNVATATFPLAYLEIIAINPAAPGPADGRKRWFGLDDTQVQARLAAQGPQLVHWVARSTVLQGPLQAWAALGLQAGDPVAASRPTPSGLLQWHIVLRPDGQLLHQGALPTLIQWQGPHPVQSMPPSGVTLQALQLGGGLPEGVRPWLQMPALRCADDLHSPALSATLQTPRGSLHLNSTP